MNDSPVNTTNRRRARAALIWVGLVAPLAILLLAAAVMIAWLPEMPDPVAVHWSGDGPDGFGPPWVNVVIPLGVGVGIVVLFAAFGLFAQRLPSHRDGAATLLPRSPQDPTVTMRFLGAINLGLSAMLAVVGLAASGVQRGLADAADAPDIGVWVLLGFCLLVIVSVIGWFLQPATPKSEPWGSTAESGHWQGESAAPLPLAAGGRAAWFGTSTLSRPAVITLSFLVFAVLVPGVVLVALGRTGGWFPVGTGLVLIALMLTTSVFHVRADASGLHVRSAVGWPRFAVAADEIAAVRAVEVNPLADFGGWGIRWGLNGRFGIVLRTGEGIEVVRANGKILVVTLDDAVTAAAVLSAAASVRKGEK